MSGFGKWSGSICAACASAWLASPSLAHVEYVVQISVDGLRPDAITNQSPAVMPNFYRLRAQGAFTDNARTDVNYTSTLQNHTCMLTGRPVLGAEGHNYLQNDVPPPGQTLHTNKGSYIAGAFDVAHDHGLRTGMYASKLKFSLYDASYGPDPAPLMGGAPDVTGPDNGRDKIDDYGYSDDSAVMVGDWANTMKTPGAYQYSFIHFHDPDAAGHHYGWDVQNPDGPYLQSARDVDARIGEILATIDNTPALAGHTAIILTADHGGTQGTGDHADPTNPQNYTIPLYVWGAGVPAGDLYAFNSIFRTDPGTSQVPYGDPFQPIRNGETGNLALSLLGLGPIPGSVMNARQDLVVSGPLVPEPAFLVPMGALAVAAFVRLRVRGV